jgi:hypothetical protein
MIWTLRNFRTFDSIITDFTIYAIQPDRSTFLDHPFSEVFNQEQIKCMRDFLLFSCENEDCFDDTVARKNLDRLIEAFPEIEEAPKWDQMRFGFLQPAREAESNLTLGIFS